METETYPNDSVSYSFNFLSSPPIFVVWLYYYLIIPYNKTFKIYISPTHEADLLVARSSLSNYSPPSLIKWNEVKRLKSPGQNPRNQDNSRSRSSKERIVGIVQAHNWRLETRRENVIRLNWLVTNDTPENHFWEILTTIFHLENRHQIPLNNLTFTQKSTNPVICAVSP